MRFFIILFSAFLLSQPIMAQEKANSYRASKENNAVLERVETYLTGIHTISAEFTQVAPNGDVSSGKFYLERPGKLRMDYEPSLPVLMVMNGNHIIYYDKELDQVTPIPLKSTLVGFLARPEVKFDNTVVITGLEHGNKSLRLSLVQSTQPKDGTLTLEFSDDPLVIRNMVVTDGSGQVTTVSLNNARFNVPLNPDLFIFNDPHLGRKGSIKK